MELRQHLVKQMIVAKVDNSELVARLVLFIYLELVRINLVSSKTLMIKL